MWMTIGLRLQWRYWGEDELPECTCRDGIMCDSCAAAQIAQTQSTIVNPLLTTEEVEELTASITAWLKSSVA
jgi:hypothetical protein